jgi:hypothetical protein
MAKRQTHGAVSAECAGHFFNARNGARKAFYWPTLIATKMQWPATLRQR